MKWKCFSVSLLLAFLYSCESERTDEELKEAIFGTWECTLITEEKESFTPEKDSTLFYESGKIKQLSFTNRGFLNITGEQLNTFTYFISDGNLFILKDRDTSVSEILFLENRKMILDEGDSKKYYDKFVY